MEIGLFLVVMVIRGVSHLLITSRKPPTDKDISTQLALTFGLRLPPEIVLRELTPEEKASGEPHPLVFDVPELKESHKIESLVLHII